ncbi:c2 domain containing protein [Chrysochromulina tobinii]|uniref:C2 domain containing protein n=1 Tax=Chrysochromulina tobinii TaxID=1460289 RepID=A0A0M0K9X0_9EUKA|nr:c2 domain containing protein [Chrysochromulina tobinii]|eukprot:KOO35615.1 c2 domain containing protein [Chrysochromulina sp. CCMP291]
MPLYDPKFAELDFDAGGDDDPTPVGFLLCSFELRAYQPPKSLDAPDGTKSAAIVDLSSQAAKLSKYHLTEGVSALGYLRPEMRPYVIEVQLVGCRDVPPREVLGAPVFLTSPYEITPYVEFEYGDEQAEEREWRIPDHGSSITGTQLRTGKIIPFVGDDWDPVMGITAINLLEHMPEEQAKIKEAKARKMKEAEEEAQKKEKERDEKIKKEKVQGGHFQIVKSPNEEKLDELFLSSVARATNGSKALSVSAGKNVAPVPALMASLIRYEGDEELKLFLKEDPPANLRKLFAEKPCRVRVHVYGATSLAPRAGGKEPEPFLKVYNVEGQERTTRDIALPPSLEPDFYQSFELSAILPGQSRLHLEVWDYQLLSESLLGKTVIDLEDRYFSETWKTKQQNDALPKEMRPLTNPGNTNAQGFIVCKIEILEKK